MTAMVMDLTIQIMVTILGMMISLDVMTSNVVWIVEFHYTEMKRIGGYSTIKETSIQKQMEIQSEWKFAHKRSHSQQTTR